MVSIWNHNLSLTWVLWIQCYIKRPRAQSYQRRAYERLRFVISLEGEIRPKCWVAVSAWSVEVGQTVDLIQGRIKGMHCIVCSLSILSFKFADPFSYSATRHHCCQASSLPELSVPTQLHCPFISKFFCFCFQRNVGSDLSDTFTCENCNQPFFLGKSTGPW